MAGKPMSAEIKKVFDDLDDYLRFCKEFGWAYNEADLYREDAPAYAEYKRFKAGTRIPKIWMRDAKFRLEQYQKRSNGHFASNRRN